MLPILLFLPILVLISGLALYRHNGKREILRMDVVQFTYAFVFLPIIFIWLKSFLFVFLKSELSLSLSFSEFFFIDTGFSTLFMFIYAFVVIHSLTKSFDLKRYEDPLYDFFDHSEFFHLVASHVAIYIGALVLTALVGGISLFFPQPVIYSKPIFFSILVGSVLSGLAGFTGVWNGFSGTWKTGSPTTYMRLMKLIFGLIFTIFVVIYFTIEPSFSSKYLLFWFVFFMLFTLVVLGLVAEQPETPRRSFGLPFQINLKKIAWYFLYTKRRLGAWTSQRR